MSNLSGSIEQLLTPRLMERLSAQSGVPDAKVRTGMTGAVASILDGLVGKAHDPRTMGQVADLVQNAPATDSPERMLDDDTSLQRNTSQLLGLAGSDSKSMVTRVSRYVGVGGTAAGGIIAAAAAVIVGGFRKLATARGGLDANALSSTLIDESRAIHAAVPPSMLNGDAARIVTSRSERYRSEAREMRERLEGRREGYASEHPRPWWLIGLIALAALLLGTWLFGRNHKPSTPPVQTSPKATEPAAPQTPSATPSPTAPQAPAGLDFPATSAEGKLLATLRAPNPVGQPQWIGLDAKFDSGKASLQSGAGEQLNHVAAVLEAYPKARVEVAGFTDNTGTADTSRVLSQQRAEAVRQALIDQGVDGSRITATGYGQQRPGQQGQQAGGDVAIQVLGR